MWLGQRSKSECWGGTAARSQCLHGIWETGCSGITFLVATISGHRHAEQWGMQQSLCAVLLAHCFHNSCITFTFASFLPLHLKYKSLWCAVRDSVPCNSGKISLIRSCCRGFTNGRVFFFKPYCISEKGILCPKSNELMFCKRRV